MLSFAIETEIKPDRTRQSLEDLMRKVGADRYMVGYDKVAGHIGFELGGRRFRFTVPLPTKDDPQLETTAKGQYRPIDKRAAAMAQLERTRWRTLLLAIKAKLAEVEVGLVSVEEAFLANLVLPSGRTVAEETRETIRLAYEGGSGPLLALPDHNTGGRRAAS